MFGFARAILEFASSWAFQSFVCYLSSLQCLTSQQPVELGHYLLCRSKHWFAFHLIHTYLLISTLGPFGGLEGKCVPCLSPGFRWLVAVVGMFLVPCSCISASSVSLAWPSPLCVSNILLFSSKDAQHCIWAPPNILNPGWSCLVIFNFITSAKTPFSKRSHSQGLDIRTWTYLFGDHHSVHYRYIRPYYSSIPGRYCVNKGRVCCD